VATEEDAGVVAAAEAFRRLLREGEVRAAAATGESGEEPPAAGGSEKERRSILDDWLRRLRS
jgi:hypothetical protein